MLLLSRYPNAQPLGIANAVAKVDHPSPSVQVL